jgi:hypothetical protein
MAEKERGLLDKLSDRLGFSHELRDELTAVARELDPKAKDRRFSDELVKLFRSIPPRVYEESADALEVVFE